MRAALLLIDLQHDFLEHPGLLPAADEVIAASARLLGLARDRVLPVIHVRTLTAEDGGDAMPHWRAHGIRKCRRGHPGADAPASLAPRTGEIIIAKRFYSGFENPTLQTTLLDLKVDTLLLCGLYTHACIRSTALDAYARGYDVIVVADAVASPEPLHAEASRQWMEERCARFSSLTRLFATSAAADEGALVAAALADADGYLSQEVSDSGWPDRLARWLRQLRTEREAYVDLLVREVRKPRSDACEEFDRALDHLQATIRLTSEPGPAWPGVSIRYRPLGSVALLTPWNNPLAIPLAKIAPALAFGNAVVWKPSPRATRISRRLHDSYLAADLPRRALQLLHGDADIARRIITSKSVVSVSLTGSIASGRSVSALCSLGDKALQAELGGNNALIILADARIGDLASELARAAFSFSGQRCTAIRRFIVERAVADLFEREMKAAIAALPLGEPDDPETVIGPLIDTEHLERIEQKVRQAIAQGARLICGGHRPRTWAHGDWYRPALLHCGDNRLPIVQEESFGPVAVMQIADDLEHALTLCNDVPHGLVAGIVTEQETARQRFLDAAQAGILRFGGGPLSVHPDAAFGGWKASHTGPPEHGIWDRQFYARPQTVYHGEQAQTRTSRSDPPSPPDEDASAC